MKNDAIINNKVVTLTDEERKGAEQFHLNRTMFIWVNGNLEFNENKDDDRDHQHWVLDDFGVTPEEWEKLPRGYMLEDRIQLFIGSTFEPLDTNNLSTDDFKKLLHKHSEIYGSLKVQVNNGVKVGKVGEIWEPIQILGVFET